MSLIMELIMVLSIIQMFINGRKDIQGGPNNLWQAIFS